jgi:hypothetical protein
MELCLGGQDSFEHRDGCRGIDQDIIPGGEEPGKDLMDGLCAGRKKMRSGQVEKLRNP